MKVVVVDPKYDEYGIRTTICKLVRDVVKSETFTGLLILSSFGGLSLLLHIAYCVVI